MFSQSTGTDSSLLCVTYRTPFRFHLPSHFLNIIVPSISSMCTELHINWYYSFCFNHQIWFNKFISRQYTTFTPIFIFSTAYLSFLKFQVSFCDQFFLLREFPLVIFKDGFASDTSFFPLKCFYSLSFLKDIFEGYRIHGWQFLSLALGNVAFLPPGLCGFRWEIICHWNGCSSLSNVPFLSGCFQDFLLFLYFRSFITMYFDMNFFGLIPVLIQSSSSVCNVNVFSKIWEDSAIFTLNSFFSSISFLSFWDSDGRKVSSFLIVQQVAGALFISFHPLSLYCSECVNPNVLFSGWSTRLYHAAPPASVHFWGS